MLLPACLFLPGLALQEAGDVAISLGTSDTVSAWHVLQLSLMSLAVPMCTALYLHVRARGSA